MAIKTLQLPKLTGISPTLDSTILKMIEEIGELARELELLDKNEGSIIRVAEELLDLAQTVVTLMFVLEDEGILVEEWLNDHIDKLIEKKYLEPKEKDKIFLKSDGQYRYLALPELKISGVTLDKTLRNINKAMGRIAQARGKFRALSGEKIVANPLEIDKMLGLSLLHVAQCCYTMLYELRNKYKVNIEEIVENHLKKLRKRGYLKDQSA